MGSNPATSTPTPPPTGPTAWDPSLTPAKRPATDNSRESNLYSKSRRLSMSEGQRSTSPHSRPAATSTATREMNDSKDEAEDPQPRLSWKDKGKSKVRPVAELPEEVWKRVFELYYDQCTDDWGTSGQIRGGLLPLLISPTHARVATPVLYSHPHISAHSIAQFMTCVEYPTRYSDAPTKVPLVKHLTVRPTPIMPAYEQIIVEAGKPEVVNPLFPSLTAMFPRVHSFTLKDTLVLCSEDAKCVFAALANVAPKKARIELRMWDLYDSAIGPDLIAATRPNVYAIPQPRPTGAMSSPPNGAGVHSSPILPISTQQAWRDSIVAGLDLHLPSEWVDPRQSNNDGDQDNNNNHNLISAPRIIPGPGPGQAPSRMTGPNSSGATRGILINGPAGTSNNRTLFTGLTQRLGSSAGPRSSPSVIAAAMMSIPQVSRYGLQNVSRAARRIATMAADETMNDENDSRERDNQQDADSEGDGDAWGLDSDSETSEGLARALRDEANMGAAEERRIRLNAARTRTVKARDQAEEARYNILLARASAGVTCGDYGDEEDPALGDPGYIRLRDAWRAAEAEERAIAEETNAELGRAGDAGSSSNPSVLRSTNSSPAPAPAVPNAARSRTVTAPGHGAAILSGQASTTASGVATTTAPTSNLPLRVDTSSISAPAPTSSKSQPRQPIQPVMAAARDFIHTRSASAGTSSTPAFGDSDGTGVVTRARAISLKSTPPTASMSPTVAGQIQPSSSANTTPTAPATGSTPKALPSYGLTYAQRCRVDHIYYPPQQEADPPVAGPSGTSDSSGLSRSFVESDSGITQFRPGTVPNPNVGGSANTAPVRLTASVRQTRGASYFQAHQMRTMLLELIQNQWSQSLEAFSFVAFDPLASLVVRAPKLDFWVNVPVEHIRVHLPRGVNSLAIFKSAKQMERDRIQARRETAPDARNEETGGDEEDPVLAILATLADGILPEDEMVQVVGGDAMGYGLVHPSNRLFEIEVNTVRDMMDDMWIQAGSQLPPQVCRILLGEQDWSEVIPGRRRYPTSEANEPEDFPSPQTDDYPSPSYSFSSLGSSDEEAGEDADADGDGVDGDEGGGCYDAEAAKRQAERVAARRTDLEGSQ